ncbi:hypothetical protein [Limoniibacter endophyticus]|uniref:Uncharacterized protein n=1 Tax=Limoniibacter endophyticus TaxID=1565040 RepID=A0A8J3DPD9_9HYPH|nr:hypothetical protein [Limoniibacter endophyticus]GHC76667.1 hypothetical protein GCM10010136_27560 [Limoniibacter endophyticus]
MANFVPVLKKTIDGLAQNTPAMREKVYEKARKAFEAKLASITPAPSQTVIDRQKSMLEEAILEVEASYAEPVDPVDNSFASIFSDFSPEPAPVPAPVQEEEPEASPRAFSSDAYEQESSAEPAFDEEAHGNGYRDRHNDEDYDAPLGVSRDAAEDGEEEPYAYRDDEDDRPALAQAPRRRTKAGARRRRRGLVAGLISLLVVAAVGSAVWFKGDEISTALGLQGGSNVASNEGAADGSAQPEGTQASQPEPEQAPKLTQRLNEDGSETDAGPSGGEQTIGEGTSIAEASPPETQAESGQAANDPNQQGNQAVAVGQRAIFYEERTNVAQGSAQAGSVVWSLVQESPGGEGPPEAAIRAEATIPDMDVQLRMTIRRNTDASLPASHIVEMIFLTPDGFAGGGIDRVLRVTMKDNEQAPGQPLLGIPAKIADGFFLVALNDAEADRRINLNLLRRDSWIDIPMIYKSGRRALITVEKGVPGEEIFQQALDAWEQAASQTSN